MSCTEGGVKRAISSDFTLCIFVVQSQLNISEFCYAKSLIERQLLQWPRSEQTTQY
jgi:hypothetical protein